MRSILIGALLLLYGILLSHHVILPVRAELRIEDLSPPQLQAELLKVSNSVSGLEAETRRLARSMPLSSASEHVLRQHLCCSFKNACITSTWESSMEESLQSCSMNPFLRPSRNEDSLSGSATHLYVVANVTASDSVTSYISALAWASQYRGSVRQNAVAAGSDEWDESSKLFRDLFAGAVAENAEASVVTDRSTLSSCWEEISLCHSPQHVHTNMYEGFRFRNEIYTRLGVEPSLSRNTTVAFVTGSSSFQIPESQMQKMKSIVAAYGLAVVDIDLSSGRITDRHIHLLSSVGLMVGASSTVLSSLVFMRPQTAVIELFPFGVQPVYYERLAHVSGVYHYFVQGQCTGDDASVAKLYESSCFNQDTAPSQTCESLASSLSVTISLRDFEYEFAVAADHVGFRNVMRKFLLLEQQSGVLNQTITRPGPSSPSIVATSSKATAAHRAMIQARSRTSPALPSALPPRSNATEGAPVVASSGDGGRARTTCSTATFRGNSLKRFQFLVTGCGRSGTTYLSHLLTKLIPDIRVQHERHGVGNVDWMVVGQDESMYNYTVYGSRVHVVRNPVRVIQSARTFAESSWEFICRASSCTMDMPLLERSACYWVEWNRMAEARTSATYRIEEFQDSPSATFLKDFLCSLGFPSALSDEEVVDGWRAVPTTTNTRLRTGGSYAGMDIYKWNDLQPLIGTWAPKVYELAIKYGYTDKDLTDAYTEFEE